MNYFVFFPSIYICGNKNTYVVYDTDSGAFSTFESKEVNDFLSTENLWFEIDETNIKFARMFENKGYGYKITSKAAPFYPKRQINIISSLKKRKELLGNDDGYMIKDLLENITIYAKNSHLKHFTQEEFQQINYPALSEQVLSEDIIEKLAKCSVKYLTIAGDLDNYMIDALLPKFAKISTIIIRSFVTIDLVHNLMSFVASHPDVYIQALVNDKKTVDAISEACNGCLRNISIHPIVSSIQDLSLYNANRGELHFLPVVTKMVNNDIINELKLNECDVFVSSRDYDDILSNSKFHKIFNKTLTILSDGTISCAFAKIGNIYNEDLYHALNSWIYKEDCVWWYTRDMYEPCKNCALRHLCPSITIYEMQGILKRICFPELCDKYNS